MTVAELARALDAEIVAGGPSAGPDVSRVCACDLMSDVLSFCCEGAILLTGLANVQTVRTAEMADVAVIYFVRGKRPSADIVELACEKNIPLLATKLTMYAAAGRLNDRKLEACLPS